jgi:protein-S-isoprenylcysteine O-methyltransferase Ste14
MLKFTLLVYLILYIGIVFVWRSYRVWKATGLNPYQLGGTDNAHDLIGKFFRLTLGLVLGVVASYLISASVYALLMPITWLETPFFQWTGIALLAISLPWLWRAQADMGQSWRIGIDVDHTTTLVSTGLFRFSRNPIFLGMGVTLLGIFFVLPNVLSLLTLVLGGVLMQIQVRLEEEHLLRLHGEAYRAYIARVRRWI